MDTFEQTIQSLEHFIEKKEQLKQIHPLRYLFWEATLRCNLNCLHCGSDCYKDNNVSSDELDISVIKNELSEIAKNHDPKLITFAIIGGEPLVRPEILEVGAYASRLGYHWGITTNGMLLDKEMIMRLKSSGLQTISVSLDGLEEDHDRLRNFQGSYQKVIKGMRLLVKTPFFRVFDAVCCVNKLNIDTLGTFVENLIEIGIPAVRFVPIFLRGRASRNTHLILDKKDYLTLLNFVTDIRKAEQRIKINLGEEGYWGPEWECQVRDYFHYCGSGIIIGSILYNGDVTGCPSVSRKFIEGNVKQAPFVDIWENGFIRYRKGKRELFRNKCGSCAHWDLCEGGGFHLLDQDFNQNICNYKHTTQFENNGRGIRQ